MHIRPSALRPRSTLWALLALAILTIPAAAPSTMGLDAAQDAKTLFARPYIMRVMAPDPWMGGAWFATDGGLFFKDLGSGAVRIYSVSDGLPSAVVEDVSVGPTQVWVATLGGVVVLDKSSQAIEWLHASDGSAYTYPTDTVFLDQGTAYLGSDTFGLFKADAGSLEVSAVPNPVDGNSFTKPIFGLGAVGSELYISVYGYGLVRWDRDTGQAWKYDFSYNHKDDPHYLRLATSPADVWIGTDGDGVMRLRRSDWVMAEYAAPETTNDLTVLAPTVVGSQVWMATRDGAARYDTQTDSWVSWTDVLPGDAANSIALADGTVYAATTAGQVARYDESSQDWVPAHWWDQDRVPQYNLVNGCQVDGDRLLFATGGGGADFYDPATGLWSRAGMEPGDHGTLSDIFVWRTASDDARRYFANNNAVTEMDKATGQYTTLYTDGRVGAGRGPNQVRDVEFQGNSVWFAAHAFKPRTREGTFWDHGGVTRMDYQTHAMTFYSTAAGLNDENVTRAVPDGDRVWIGTEKGGLDVLDQKSGTIQNVFMGQGHVSDILVRPDGVWVAAGLDGILRLDPATMQVTRMPVLDGIAAWTLLDNGSTIWVGTAYKGLYAFDPVAQQATHYGTSSHIDYMVNCMVMSQGLLYLGTPWGVERFDLATHKFLPQAGRLAGSSAAGSGSSGVSTSIAIQGPADGASVQPGASIPVSGSAQAPDGARVLVRIGAADWQPADGLSSWSQDVKAPSTVGPATISARLEVGGDTVAQTAITVYVGTDAAHAQAMAAQASALRHVPILEVGALEPLSFRVDGAGGLPNPVAHVELRAPGATTFQTYPMPLDGNGSLAVDLPPVGAPGQGAYRIVVQWDGGAAQFPQPLSGYGDAYPLLVASNAADAGLLVSGQTAFTVVPGRVNHLNVTVQNPGARAALVAVSVSGAAGPWLAAAPKPMRIDAASTQVLGLDVSPPAGQKDGHYDLDLVFAPASGLASTHARLDLAIGAAAPASGHGSKLSPVPVWLVLVALGAVAAARRRRA